MIGKVHEGAAFSQVARIDMDPAGKKNKAARGCFNPPIGVYGPPDKEKRPAWPLPQPPKPPKFDINSVHERPMRPNGSVTFRDQTEKDH